MMDPPADEAHLRCNRCRRRHNLSEVVWRCCCGGPFELEGTGPFSIDALKNRPANIWRYREAFGFGENDEFVSLGEGQTQLVSCDIGATRVLLKLEGSCPTGSFKDRGSSVMISRLKSQGVVEVVEDSSGNAGASMAAYAAAAGIVATIFTPSTCSLAKRAQIRLYGARTNLVPGGRAEAERRAQQAATSAFYAAHNWSPHFLAGMKSVAFELAEQLGWTAPDRIVVPVGGGSLLLGLYAGFNDLRARGIIERVPILVGAQAANCAPVALALASGEDQTRHVEPGETIAEGICIANPIRGVEILNAIRQSGGSCEVVTDKEIWSALLALGKLGFNVEPTAATAFAGWISLRDTGRIQEAERTVIVLTSTGLKATNTIASKFELSDPKNVR